MLRNFFRPRRSNKENEDYAEDGQQRHHEQQHRTNVEFDRSMSSYKSLRNGREKRSSYSSHHHCRGVGSGTVDDSFQSSTAPYHVATQRKFPRGTQSCHDTLCDEFDRYSNMNRSFAGATHSKYKPFRREHMSSVRRSHVNSEYESCDPSPNRAAIYSRDLDDSDAETWNTERIIKELRNELRATNDRKNYYKDLYKRERQDRIRDRELRDLVEKKLMDDLRRKEIECANNLLRIKALEQQLQHQSSFPPPMRESSFRVPHFCTPSTSNTASTMAGAGEALSSTSELFAVRGGYLANPVASGTGITTGTVVPGEMLDETKIFRQPDESPLELARNSSCTIAPLEDVRNDGAAGIPTNSLSLPFSNHENVNGTMLEEDPQSDNGYGTTSECASELVRSIRRVHSDSELPLKVIQI